MCWPGQPWCPNSSGSVLSNLPPEMVHQPIIISGGFKFVGSIANLRFVSTMSDLSRFYVSEILGATKPSVGRFPGRERGQEGRGVAPDFTARCL